ncbi:hypothetical protein BDK51DRAFT_26798 [Blyttiomyces helicus]|uniref:Uncharacterized protein n=1 Tax=Blyttiomyces helicus TaxID=388810 RepID=A0A4P9WB33_9FUNG|nr:hypothetical protein BDK51DRAFT_26798 [Blyttiomyces helicus]|eukprot:RKO89442.1 hypothetical protein BDK51DRAFT_26798 [Blyttiomyces helicus]
MAAIVAVSPGSPSQHCMHKLKQRVMKGATGRGGCPPDAAAKNALFSPMTALACEMSAGLAISDDDSPERRGARSAQVLPFDTSSRADTSPTRLPRFPPIMKKPHRPFARTKTAPGPLETGEQLPAYSAARPPLPMPSARSASPDAMDIDLVSPGYLKTRFAPGGISVSS